MKIYDRNVTGTSAAETARAQESQNLSRAGTSKSPTSSGIDGSNDRVEFSGTLSRLSRALSTFDSSRANRVKHLAAQYQSGSYRPDSAATSKGIVTEAISAGLQ